MGLYHVPQVPNLFFNMFLIAPHSLSSTSFALSFAPVNYISDPKEEITFLNHPKLE
jgi:hypothetical protein